jgi:hypothetical protein
MQKVVCGAIGLSYRFVPLLPFYRQRARTDGLDAGTGTTGECYHLVNHDSGRFAEALPEIAAIACQVPPLNASRPTQGSGGATSLMMVEIQGTDSGSFSKETHARKSKTHAIGMIRN